MHSNQLLAEEQKGCWQEAKGCTKQQIINIVINEEMKENKTKLYTDSTNNKKEFDKHSN